MIYAVFRRACLMEDEGRDEFIGTRITKQGAEKLIEKEIKEGKDYFKKGDYFITTKGR